MNPSEMRMMWMSHYNPDRISLEDAATLFGHSSVGLSVMDDITHQPTMDLNPMMSIVGGEYSGQAAAAAVAAASSAAAAAALGVQPTLIANSNEIYGLAQMGGLHQQLLQQSAAAVFQNYASIIDDEEAATHNVDEEHTLGTDYISTDDTQQVYEIDDDYDEGIAGLTPKQEIINIDDFVMMTDSNSYDGTEFMSSDRDITTQTINIPKTLDDNDLLIPVDEQKLSSASSSDIRTNAASTSATTSTGTQRTQRKTRKIEPVNRPGLVLKTPIAYKGNIDPSVIPIQKDGMAVCERCGAIGVKHTFYTKSRRFCSMACARGELYSLVLNGKMMAGNQQQQQQQIQQEQPQSTTTTLANEHTNDGLNEAQDSNQDHSKLAQINGLSEAVMTNILADMTVENSNISEIKGSSTGCSDSSLGANSDDGTMAISTTKSLRMFADMLPQNGIPKIDHHLPTCPQLEKIISIRRRHGDPSHSYDWTPRLLDENFYAAPVSCFPHAPGYEVWDNIDVDMKVEVENTDCDNLEVIQPGQTPHSFWVATILNISGYKALMRYEGFDESDNDFWVNLCNSEVHSVGWCATRGKPLIPPRSIQNKYGDWIDFLVGRLSGARTLPSSFYNKVNDSIQCRFRIGLNLECVDKDCISQVRLATVTKIVGKRLFLRYFDSEDGFWCHEDAPIIHPVGWATTVGHNLSAPQDYLERMLAGREAMIEVHEDDATIELFKMNFTFEEYYPESRKNSFVEGMKLEAVDPLNLSSICAATVMAVLKFGYIMIRIDSYQPDASGSDWFCYHEKSPSIFPVGFCESNNITLTPPNGYDVNTFSWETYLDETCSLAAGQHLFHRIIPAHGFEVGMSLECADLMDPRLVCVATVSRIVGRLLKIHFDGWTDEYDQWLDCESPDVYPVGWCVLVGHKLEGPPIQVKTTPKLKPQKKRKKKFSPTSANKIHENQNTIKQRSMALKSNPHLPKLNIKSELKAEQPNSTYYDEHAEIDDDEFDDESISHRSSQSTPQSLVAEVVSSASEKFSQQVLNAARISNMQTVKKSVSPAPPSIGRKATSYIGNSSVSSSKYIPRLTDSNDISSTSNNNSYLTVTTSDAQTELTPDNWNVYDVSQFLRVNDCTAHCDTFSRNKIDGKRLMELSKDEIITMFGMKVGPALKIFDLIQQLKCKINPSKSRLHKANKSFL
ncbi:polycomb protein Sfmbt isoform X2 [Teleopsis dalmanni]|uniref:polycomb protein Sfmbt isoform X2 n=1 Tax=Teleopsis dalmanni TaxID=139649 RepID=UPI0018CDB751|nr:polycomb protein Sfmbt isoform X2 [Teleopsis dalmanni]